jgi:hypothetical protein
MGYKMNEFLKIDVSGRTEKKGKLTYLSWAWAWTVVLENDPDATWDVATYNSDEGYTPCMYMRDGTAMVKVNVTIKERTKTAVLPVMNHKNQAIENPNSFQINTAIMRCLAKAISMHGIGLSIYAGEDLPPDDKPAPIIPASPKTEDLDIDPEVLVFIEELAAGVKELVQTNPEAAVNMIYASGLDGDQAIALNNMLDSKTRTALKKVKEQKNAV